MLLALAAPKIAHPLPADATSVAVERSLYDEIGLGDVVSRDAFDAAMQSATLRGITPHMFAIADMTQPSTAQRLFIIDLDTKKLALKTWVAHGQNSGENLATRFSNENDSHQSS